MAARAPHHGKGLMGSSIYDVSIVIANYNGLSLLSACLESIHSTVDDLAYEIWVTDNGSTDGSVEYLRSHFPKVNCIVNAENLGFACANNQALRNCTGRYVLLLNNDTRLHNNAVQSMTDALESYPDFAAIGPQLRNGDGSIQPSCMNAPSRWGGVLSYLRSRTTGSAKFIPRSDLDVIAVDAVTGACMLIRKTALTQIGLFDQGYFMYAEEADWCYRARKLGWQIGYVPKAQVTHFGGQTAQREAGRFYVERRISRVRFKLKHYGYFPAQWDAFLISLNIWSRWIANSSQRGYYRAIYSDFRYRLTKLFRNSGGGFSCTR